ncbi:MAG: aspartate-semialdehyde dehydrogenase [Chloroflexi bacterium]|nr:aspartate-semialdehyde dehydrogenase [Chloroflexota bacterium]
MNGRGYRVAIVGATGLVGQTQLGVLEERDFPVSDLVPLASGRSAGQTVRFRGRDVEVREALPEAFEGVDFVFFAATGDLSKTLAPEAVRRGAAVIDKSGTWRMGPRVPLVVPEINPEAVDSHEGILSCPNCTTIGFVMALEPIRRLAGVREVTVTTLQAVSGAGKDGAEELAVQAQAAARGEQPPAPRTFTRPIHHNVLPLCERFRDDGYSTEEIKLLDETRKILVDPAIRVAMTCVRVPVAVGHSCTALIETERPVTLAEAHAALAAFPGVRVVDDPSMGIFPTPMDVAGSDEVLVGRVRRDLTSDRLWLWSVVDNLRKGAATNAVQIAETMIARDAVRPRRPALAE